MWPDYPWSQFPPVQDKARSADMFRGPLARTWQVERADPQMVRMPFPWVLGTQEGGVWGKQTRGTLLARARPATH